MCVSCSVVSDFATPWTVACQTPLSMEFSRQEYWSGLAFPSPGDLPDPGTERRSFTLKADSLLSEPPGKPRVELVSSKWMEWFFPWAVLPTRSSQPRKPVTFSSTELFLAPADPRSVAPSTSGRRTLKRWMPTKSSRCWKAVALASEERVSSSFSVFSILGEMSMLSGHRSQHQTPGDPTHVSSVRAREVLPTGGNHTLSPVPGLALLRGEGCQWSHVAAVIQQHVCELHQVVGPGPPVCRLLWRQPELRAEGLKQTGGGGVGGGGQGHGLGW